jgi:2-hydroxychromene-2-carboxylate isomerase
MIIELYADPEEKGSHHMSEPIRFHFDPLCPWSYQTSRWVRRLEELGEVSVDWRVFSLAIANRGDEGRAASREGSAPALRTAVRIHDEHGPAAVGRFYAALGAAIHEEERGDDGPAVDDPELIAAAVRQAGLDPALADRAMADPATWAAVQREHDEVVATHRAFGVPTIVLDGGTGPATFGPVITEVPGDAEAVELWRHVAWLVRCENFSELKRDRTRQPDLASVRRWERRRAGAAA